MSTELKRIEDVTELAMLMAPAMTGYEEEYIAERDSLDEFCEYDKLPREICIPCHPLGFRVDQAINIFEEQGWDYIRLLHITTPEGSQTFAVFVQPEHRAYITHTLTAPIEDPYAGFDERKEKRQLNMIERFLDMLGIR